MNREPVIEPAVITRLRSEVSSELEKDTATSGSPCSDCLGFPFKVEGSMGWAGNLPCVHGPKEGCSHHNPLKLPIAWNQRIPSDKKKPGVIERFRGLTRVADYDEIRGSVRIWSSLHLDHSTADPLDPIHQYIHYALAYYHLNWVKIGESQAVQKTRASSLACNGTVVGDGRHRPDFQFWISPYWHNSSFLLHEVVRFTIEPKKRHPLYRREVAYLGYPSADWTFQPCPHCKHHFEAYEFSETRGLLKATMSYQTKRGHSVGEWPSHITRWKSVHGPSAQAYNCQHCCTDNVVHTTMTEDKIVVHMYVFKDLGNVRNAYDAKWIAALRFRGPSLKRSKTEMSTSLVRNTVMTAVNAAKHTPGSPA
ncbi:hypothetical protein F4804DRAFT_338073 [Jackrogersella minutella]|nr:hypothetical protein F4804DRAFT_338073 [Jackrogersella minutella]